MQFSVFTDSFEVIVDCLEACITCVVLMHPSYFLFLWLLFTEINSILDLFYFSFLCKSKHFNSFFLIFFFKTNHFLFLIAIFIRICLLHIMLGNSSVSNSWLEITWTKKLLSWRNTYPSVETHFPECWLVNGILRIDELGGFMVIILDTYSLPTS